jgi:S-adenosylmethionine:tRNA ribosyltransferase-isomerase
MLTEDFDYQLPTECIAQTPVEPRDSSRLLVLHRQTGLVEHRIFRNIQEYLCPGDILVLNQTRVIPARIFGRKIPGGGKVEILLLKRLDGLRWEALVGGKGLGRGKLIQVEGGPLAEIIEVLDGPRRVVQFTEPPESFLERVGQMPLPPYIHMPLANPNRYQTVYAQLPGSAAAPTAGLHFTPELLSSLEKGGIQLARVTLHVGLDTFAPVNEDNPLEHHIHTEMCQVDEDAAAKINQARTSGGRVIAVGTTSVRTLESACSGQEVHPFEGSTGLFILPGYEFRVVDAMITNFHLPRSTLIMLVSAFAGRQQVLDAYRQAVSTGYRFYSFGDAMLIL